MLDFNHQHGMGPLIQRKPQRDDKTGQQDRQRAEGKVVTSACVAWEVWMLALGAKPEY
ncbi:hypothetical protein FHW96_003647 [Novosphingobium sp. SG751A]|nr:hypothetical protein [Novosphingobium sp. SG751A]